jgi:hypothetical protein
MPDLLIFSWYVFSDAGPTILFFQENAGSILIFVLNYVHKNHTSYDGSNFDYLVGIVFC